jgi:hypothetical protein
MTIQNLIILLITGLLAGFVSGALGIGGAIIIVPFLVFFVGMTQLHAQGTSLAVLLFPVGIFAVINYARNGYVNYKYATILILAFMLGGYLGSLLSVNLSEKFLQKAFAILLLIVGAKLFFSKI